MIKCLLVPILLIYLSVIQINAQSNYLAVHSPNNGKWGYIDDKAKTVIPFIFDDATDFSDGLAAVKQNEKYGFIDINGKIVIPCQFEQVFSFNEAMAAFIQNEKFGFIDKKGNVIVKPELQYAESFKGGLAMVRQDGKYYYIDKLGNKVISTNVDLKFVNGLAAFADDGKYGYINNKGKFIIPAEFLRADDFYNGRALVQFIDEKFGFIDSKGKTLFTIDYPPNNNFNEGLASIVKDGKVGFIDTTGKLVIENKYSTEITFPVFSQGLCNVALDDKMLIIDKKGKIIKELEDGYYLSKFCEGMAIVSNRNGFSAVLNQMGNYITEFKYKQIHDYSEGLAVAVTENMEYEILDKKGAIVAKFGNAYPDVGTDFKYKNGICKLHTYLAPDSSLSIQSNTQNGEYIKQYGGVIDIYVDRSGKLIWKSAPWYSCFPSGTLVSMADGTQKEIQDVQVGDMVISYSQSDKKFIQASITEVKCFIGKSILSSISFSTDNELTASLNFNLPNNHYLNATAMHPFLTENGMKRVKDLNVGDILFYKDPNRNEMEKVMINQVFQSRTITNKVYSLKTVSGNYMVEGIVVLMK